jgi:hypothetical protein
MYNLMEKRTRCGDLPQHLRFKTGIQRHAAKSFHLRLRGGVNLPEFAAESLPYFVDQNEMDAIDAVRASVSFFNLPCTIYGSESVIFGSPMKYPCNAHFPPNRDSD